VLRDLVGQDAGTLLPQVLDLLSERCSVPAHSGCKRRPLADSQAHLHAELPAQVDGLGVVVAVDLGDQETADVGEGVTEEVQRRTELITCLLDCPACVDQDHAGAAGQ
jgi:hypothetical protein